MAVQVIDAFLKAWVASPSQALDLLNLSTMFEAVLPNDYLILRLFVTFSSLRVKILVCKLIEVLEIVKHWCSLKQYYLFNFWISCISYCGN